MLALPSGCELTLTSYSLLVAHRACRPWSRGLGGLALRLSRLRRLLSGLGTLRGRLSALLRLSGASLLGSRTLSRRRSSLSRRRSSLRRRRMSLGARTTYLPLLLSLRCGGRHRRRTGLCGLSLLGGHYRRGTMRLLRRGGLRTRLLGGAMLPRLGRTLRTRTALALLPLSRRGRRLSRSFGCA